MTSPSLNYLLQFPLNHLSIFTPTLIFIFLYPFSSVNSHKPSTHCIVTDQNCSTTPTFLQFFNRHTGLPRFKIDDRKVAADSQVLDLITLYLFRPAVTSFRVTPRLLQVSIYTQQWQPNHYARTWFALTSRPGSTRSTIFKNTSPITSI